LALAVAMVQEGDDDALQEEEAGADDMGDEPADTINFADLLGPECVIKRVDKDQKVVGHAQPQDMQRELMARASTQKRLGACAEHVKDKSRKEKLEWAVGLKETANEFYERRQFKEAAELYNDCLVALDLEGTPEEVQECKSKLQLPVCTNLAACMIELGKLELSIDMCDIALSIDPSSARALYRRGLARYRLGDHDAARPDFEAALESIRVARASAEAMPSTADATQEQLASIFADIESRASVYLRGMRRKRAEEKQACKRMFSEQDGLYKDRPVPRLQPEEPDAPIDDSDEAIDAALNRARSNWSLCPCRRGHGKRE